MFVSVSRTYSNPVTVANLIRVNGLDAVRRCGLVQPDILRNVRRSVMRGEYAEYRKLLCGRRITPKFMAMMKFARRHGAESLTAADRQPFSARLVAGMIDAWLWETGAGEAGRRHGWDVGLRIGAMSRAELYRKSLAMGLDLEAMRTLAAAEVANGHGNGPGNGQDRATSSIAVHRLRAGARIMRRTCGLFRITPDDLCSKGRTNDVAIPRHFYAYYAKRLGKFSFPEIGKRLGGRDHTTALNSVKRWPECRDEARKLIAAHKGRG